MLYLQVLQLKLKKVKLNVSITRGKPWANYNVVTTYCTTYAPKRMQKVPSLSLSFSLFPSTLFFIETRVSPFPL